MSNPRSIDVCKKPAPEIDPNAKIRISVSFTDRRFYRLYVTPIRVEPPLPGSGYSTEAFVLYDQRKGWKSGAAVIGPRVEQRFSMKTLQAHADTVSNNLDKAWPYLLDGNIETALAVLVTGDVPTETPTVQSAAEASQQ